LVGAAAVGLVLGVGLTVLLPPSSVASSEVMFQVDPADPKRADTEARIANSQAVMDRVAALTPGTDAKSLAKSLSTVTATHDVVRLTASANSPARARELIDRYTDSYIDYSGGVLRQTAADQATGLTRQLDPVNVQLAATTERLNQIDSDPRVNATGPQGDAARTEQTALQRSQDRLGQNITDLQGKIAAEQVAADLHDYFTAINRTVPSAPGFWARLRMVAAPTLLLPILAATGIAVARRRDMRLYSAETIARAAGAPVPATVGVPTTDARVTVPTGAALDDAETLRYRRAVAGVLSPDETGLVSSITMVRPAGDRAAAWAADQFAGLLPPGAPVVRQLEAHAKALPDLDPGSRVVLVLTAGTLTAGALHTLAAACHDAGRSPHSVLLVAPARPAPPARPQWLRRGRRGPEPVGSATA
jgi:hypothetical protein